MELNISAHPFRGFRSPPSTSSNPTTAFSVPKGTAFPDGTNTLEDAQAFYDDMLDTFQINNPKFRNGYGNLNLSYAFQYSVPNNSTPLLWWPANKTWQPLFRR